MKDGRAIWFTTVLILLGGYVGIVRTGEARIAEQRAAQAQIIARFEEDELRLRGRAALEAERARLRRRVSRFDLTSQEATLVARFVHDVVGVAARHRLQIVTIAAEQTTGADAAVRATANALFATTPLDVTLEGRYNDVLRGVRDLSRAHVLVHVELASLMRTHPDGPGATVTAALRVVVERFAAHPDAQPGHA